MSLDSGQGLPREPSLSLWRAILAERRSWGERTAGLRGGWVQDGTPCIGAEAGVRPASHPTRSPYQHVWRHGGSCAVLRARLVDNITQACGVALRETTQTAHPAYNETIPARSYNVTMKTYNKQRVKRVSWDDGNKLWVVFPAPWGYTPVYLVPEQIVTTIPMGRYTYLPIQLMRCCKGTLCKSLTLKSNLSQLHAAMIAAAGCRYGLWTNGLEFFFFQKEKTRFDEKFMPLGDWPMAALGHWDPGTRVAGASAACRSGEERLMASRSRMKPSVFG